MSFFKKFRTNKDEENLSANAGSFPLSCKQVGENLQSFLDGETTEVSSADLSAHLEACKDCGLEVDVYRKIKMVLSNRSEPVDADSLSRLQEFGRQLAESGEE